MHAFEKHLAGENKPYELLKNGSWTSGDEAAQAGFDLRLFYKALLPIYHLTLAGTTWSLCWMEASAPAQPDVRHGEGLCCIEVQLSAGSCRAQRGGCQFWKTAGLWKHSGRGAAGGESIYRQWLLHGSSWRSCKALSPSSLSFKQISNTCLCWKMPGPQPARSHCVQLSHSVLLQLCSRTPGLSLHNPAKEILGTFQVLCR